MSVVYQPKPKPQPQPKRTPAVARQRTTMPWGRVLRAVARFAGLVVALAIITFAGWWILRHPVQPKLQSVNRPPLLETERIQPSPIYLSAEDAKADQKITFSYSSPNLWQSARLPEDANRLLDRADYQIGLFDFKLGADSAALGSSLTLENVSSWLKHDGSSGDLVELAKQQAKQDFINRLIKLRSTRTVTQDDIAKLPMLAGETGSKQRVLYAHSADGKLSGIIYVALKSDLSGVHPAVISLMAGAVDGQTVLGELMLLAGGQVDTAAFGAGNIGESNIELEDNAQQLVESLTLDTSTRDATAPALVR